MTTVDLSQVPTVELSTELANRSLRERQAEDPRLTELEARDPLLAGMVRVAIATHQDPRTPGDTPGVIEAFCTTAGQLRAVLAHVPDDYTVENSFENHVGYTLTTDPKTRVLGLF